MTYQFETHIISGDTDLSERFENKPGLLNRISRVSKEFETEVWNKLTKEEFIGEFELQPQKFQNFESIDFSKDYNLVTQSLNSLKEGNSRVLLIWNAGIGAVVTDTANFVENWDDFFYPSSDDLIVISEKEEWMIYLAHYECLFLGEVLKINKG